MIGYHEGDIARNASEQRPMGSKKERTMTARETADYDAMRALKDSIRVQAKSNRQRQEKNEELSRRICETTILLAEFARPRPCWHT